MELSWIVLVHMGAFAIRSYRVAATDQLLASEELPYLLTVRIGLVLDDPVPRLL